MSVLNCHPVYRIQNGNTPWCARARTLVRSSSFKTLIQVFFFTEENQSPKMAIFRGLKVQLANQHALGGLHDKLCRIFDFKLSYKVFSMGNGCMIANKKLIGNFL